MVSKSNTLGRRLQEVFPDAASRVGGLRQTKEDRSAANQVRNRELKDRPWLELQPGDQGYDQEVPVSGLNVQEPIPLDVEVRTEGVMSEELDRYQQLLRDELQE